MAESVERREVRRLLALVEGFGDVLSTWEIDFVDSLTTKIGDPDFEPSERQLDKLNEITERY